MKKLTAPDATAIPGTRAPKVKVSRRGLVKINPPRKNLRPLGWVS